MRKQYLECGKVVTTHGVAGEVRLQPWCDSPEELVGVKTLYLDAAGTEPVRIVRARPHKNVVILRFALFQIVIDCFIGSRFPSLSVTSAHFFPLTYSCSIARSVLYRQSIPHLVLIRHS